MKLSEYLRMSWEISREAPRFAHPAMELTAEIARENAASGGEKYPTMDAMWKEAIARAEARESEQVKK